MTGFIRTQSGISNYSKFFGVDITVFIEGKMSVSNPNVKTYDQFFYETISKALVPEKKFKFKTLGNKHTVLKHAELISNSHGTITAIAIVDKDFDSLRLSLLKKPNLYYTHSYSWENDLLNLDLSLDVITDLAPLARNESKDLLSKRFSLAKKRIEYISTLDAILQINSETILPKRGNSCGVSTSDNNQVIDLHEIKRLRKKYESYTFHNSDLAKELLVFIKNKKLKESLVQGHLWCFVIKRIIADVYKSVTRDKSLTSQSIFNLILSKFASNPLNYMSNNLQQHYRLVFN